MNKLPGRTTTTQSSPVTDPLLKAVHEFVPRNARAVVAVSGGVDSVALLHALAAAAPTLKLKLVVAHLDHGFRPESRAEARAVKLLAKNLGLPFAGTRLGKLPRGENLEGWARTQRYLFLRSVKREHRCGWIITAHHANDLAETLLMRLIANKDPVTFQPVDALHRLLRPLVKVTRAQVLKYAEKHQLSWSEDSSNQDLARVRNRVRAVLVPLLEREFHPNVVGMLASQALSLDEALRALSPERGLRGARWKVATLKELLLPFAAPVRWRALAGLLNPVLGYTVGQDAAKRALAVINGEQKGCEFPGGHALQRSRGWITLRSARIGSV